MDCADLAPELDFARRRALSVEKEALFRELAATSLVPMPGLLQVLEWSERFHVKRVLVTNAPRPNVDFLLATLNLEKYFPPSHQVLADDLPNPKPHPDPYLAGLTLLGIAADEGLAFEDSLAGARAAVAAQIPTVAVLTTMDADRFARPGCLCFVGILLKEERVGGSQDEGCGDGHGSQGLQRQVGRPLLALGV